MKLNKAIIVAGLGITIGLAAGLTSSALYTNAQTTATTSVSTQTVARTKRQPPTAEQMQKRQAVEEALEKGDYEAWKNAIKDTPNADELLKQIDTQDKFNKFVEAHRLVKEAHDKAEAIYKELGIQGGRGLGHGHMSPTDS